MNRRNIEKKHYSLGVTFSLFILVMASFIVVSIFIKDKKDESLQNKIQEIGHGNIETINPLILEKSQQVLDKTTANIEIINEISRVYSLDIIYGEGTEYLTDSVDAKAIYSEADVNSILIQLVNCLEQYPNNIFKEIKLKDYDVEICLVDYFSNDNIALATRDSNNNFKIYLSNTDTGAKVKKSIHHEMYHILEYYMKLQFDINELYKDWNKYNPPGFSYQENIALLDTSYVYGIDDVNGSYFVSIYSKYSDKEDRAEIFSDTMNSDVKPGYYTDNIGAIKNKMQLISNAIKNSFYSVNYGTSIYWTRFF